MARSAVPAEPRRPGFWPLALLFAAFVLFMYGPMLVIVVLSFQGPDGGLTFPISYHFEPGATDDGQRYLGVGLLMHRTVVGLPGDTWWRRTSWRALR